MKPKLANGEGVVLQVTKAGEGGRMLRLFTREEGPISGFIAKGTIKKYGPGLLFPFAVLRYTAALQEYSRVFVQYEGRLPFSVASLSYEEIMCWYYAAEIALLVFPEGQADGDVFSLLQKAAEEAKTRNPTLVAFLLSVKLLAYAGFDPAEEEPMGVLGLSASAAALLYAFRRYRWDGQLSEAVSREPFRECAAYLDAFVERYVGIEMKTRGAFAEILN